MISDEQRNMLYNWKFRDAASTFDSKDESEAALVVNSLGVMYGNMGWSNGGHLGVIINFVLDKIGVFDVQEGV